jgi:hypothetical protein
LVEVGGILKGMSGRRRIFLGLGIAVAAFIAAIALFRGPIAGGLLRSALRSAEFEAPSARQKRFRRPAGRR